MRPTNVNSRAYTPGLMPSEPNDMARYLREELVKIQITFSLLAAGHLDKSYVAPTRPRDGDLRYASGPGGWDPGSGKGVYLHNGTVWTLIKAIP